MFNVFVAVLMDAYNQVKTDPRMQVPGTFWSRPPTPGSTVSADAFRLVLGVGSHCVLMHYYTVLNNNFEFEHFY